MGRILGELGRIFAALAVVMGVAAGALLALDAVPPFLQGEPRGVVRVERIEDAERRLGARLLVPAYFPDSLRWPPAAVRYVAGPPASALLVFEARAGGEALLVAQSLRGERPPPDDLWPAATRLGTSAVSVDGARVGLERVLGPDGRFWLEASVRAHGRLVLLRSAGSAADLGRMVNSLSAHPSPDAGSAP